MPPRLADMYHPGDAVELYLEDETGEGWRPGYVLAAQHPGLWVRTVDGGLWFVTNRQHIRPHSEPDVPQAS